MLIFTKNENSITFDLNVVQERSLYQNVYQINISLNDSVKTLILYFFDIKDALKHLKFKNKNKKA